VTSFRLYVFVDSTAGAPTLGQEVWSSGLITGTTAWTSVPTINIASRLGAAGTYYLKVVAVVVTGGGSGSATGTNIVGYDNVSLHWQGTSGGSYPTSNPTISPTTSFTVSNINAWNSFTEVATKNGGEIYYQLSDNNGSTWQYWNGSAWVTAGPANYNTASVINTNITSFPTAAEQITFRAFLSSSGSQQVQLDSVSVSWTEQGTCSGSLPVCDTYTDQPSCEADVNCAWSGGGGGGFATFGSLVSSAFNAGGSASWTALAWNHDLSACSGCLVQFQVRTAPDASGSPGAWTAWYGASGPGTYFTNNAGTILPIDFNFNRWAQYRVELSGDGATTPVLNDITIRYLP
jgi:hypothetical protein